MSLGQSLILCALAGIAVSPGIAIHTRAQRIEMIEYLGNFP